MCTALCALGLTVPAAANAQSAGPKPPANAPVVAGRLANGTALVAFDHGGQLCFGLAKASSTCAAPPDAASHSQFQLHPGVVYGAVSPDVATVEVLEAGRSQTVATSTGAYQGAFAGRVRFFLAQVARTGVPYRLRFLDAQGVVVGAQDLGLAPAIGAAVAIGRGHVGPTAWRAVAVQRSHLAPSPLDRGRTEATTCLRVSFAAPREPRGAEGGSCPGRSADTGQIAFFVEQRCQPAALIVSGLAGSDVSRLQALLGDGSRRAVALRALPGRFGDPRRAFVLVVGRGVAVRSLVMRRNGHSATLPLQAGPGDARCQPSGSKVGSATFGFSAISLGPTPSGEGALLARDDGDALCVGFAAIAPSDCQLPPVEPFGSRIERRPAGARTAILAVVPAQVTAVRLRLDRGALLTLPTSDLPGYTGRYRGFVRALALTLPGDRRLYGADLLAADGHVLAPRTGPDQPPLPRALPVLSHLLGGVIVAAGDDCVQVRLGAPTRSRADCALGFTSILLAAPCAARRTVVVARLRRPAHGLDVVTDHGTVRGRRSGSFAVAIVPAGDAVRAVRLAGASRTAVRLPPAARQCGYTQTAEPK
jgi:hypothetical protein